MTQNQTAEATKVISFPFMERPVIGALLAATAGALNAWALGQAGTFATVQSGNVVVAGFALAGGDFARVGMATLSILAFGMGAFANSIAVTLLLRRGKAYSGPVLFVLAGLVALIALLAVTRALPVSVLVLGISFVAGSQGNAFHRDHGMLYGNVAVTFVVQSFFSLLGRVLLPTSRQGRAADVRTVLIFGGVLLAFAAGAFLGFFAETLVSAGALWLAALISVVLGIAAATRPRGVPVDPAQNAPTP